MALVLKTLYTNYNIVMDDLKDPRVVDWFLVTSLPKLLVGLCAWLWFVKVGGQNFMKNRKPYNLEKVMIVYNFFQIVYCLYLLQQSYHIFFNYSYTCEPVDYSDSKEAIHIATLVWLYYLLKVIDLLDTVFFVFRKKNSQMSFLHLYHHFGMVGTSFMGIKFFAGGHLVFLGFFNCIVHVAMYFYYLLSAWDKEYKKSAWWKKYLTQMQLIQFILILCFYTPNMFMSDCPLPVFVSLYLTTQNVVMLLLFGDFYYNSYIKTKKPIVISTDQDETTAAIAADKTTALVGKGQRKTQQDFVLTTHFEQISTKHAKSI